jgi:transposase
LAAKKSTHAPSPLRLLYLDECEVHRHPRLAKVWQRRGCPLRVPAAGEDGKFVVFGALDYASGQVVWQLSPRKDGKAFVAFLDHLTATFPEGPLVVVLDNVGYHKGRLAKDWWLAQHDRVRPLWLPVYAPELNLLERVWGYVKDKLSCHRWWADQAALEAATANLLSHLQARFHHPDPDGIALVHNFCEVA